MSDGHRRFAPQWIGVGVALGAGLGVAWDNLAVGIGVGIALGAALGAWQGRRS